MKRGGYLKRKKALQRGGHLKRRTRLRQRNPERARKLKAKAFGKQAKLCRRSPCLVCGKRPSDPAHVRSRGAGGRDRGNVIPLCRDHHREQHQHGWAALERVHLIDVTEEARRYEVLAYGEAA